ncbi:MAG TPA: cytochrome c [Terriglobales bacterium]|nr:cytochrome c [Terriglobales bacterium]
MKFILGLIIGIIIVPLAVFAYFVSGNAPVATSADAMPFEKTLAHKALDARVAKEAPKTVPMAADESTYMAGAQVYKDNCAVCHSMASGEPTAIAKGEFPKPPKLLQGKGVTDDEPGETYWKVANGIRLTGMPGFKQTLSDAQMWQVSLLLANADKIPESVKQTLIPTPAPPPTTLPTTTETPHTH